MGDNSRSIFLSTKGKNSDCIPNGLKAFLDFVRQDTPGNNVETDDAYVKVLQNTIRSVKASKELERSFMTLDEIRQMGKDEGIAEGMLRTRREAVLELLQEVGEVPYTLHARIMSETDVDVLKTMLKIVRTATSIEEFEKSVNL